jgi:hypothetical protein
MFEHMENRFMLTRFARDIDLVVLDSEDVLEVLEELDKVLRSFFLSGRGWGAGGKAGSNGLVNPQHIGQVHLSRLEFVFLLLQRQLTHE